MNLLFGEHFGGQMLVVAFSGMRRFFEFLCFADVHVLQYCAKENQYCWSCVMSCDCSFLRIFFFFFSLWKQLLHLYASVYM